MHGGDDYENDDSRARIDYYGITGYPTTNFDGMTGIVGGSLNGNLYESFLGLYNNRKSLRSLYSLDMELFDLGEGEYKIAINTEELYEYYDSPVYLRIALTESHIPVTWFNLDEINFVQRQMFPSPTGTLMDYSSGSDTYEHTFTLNPGYVLENCEIVAFLQVDDTKEILNGDVVDMEDALVGVDETLAYDLEIAPNPVSDFVTIKGVENGECSMYSVKGELVRTFIIKSENHVENLQALTAGTYIFSIRTERGTVYKTVVKQ
jgi:hypothetical protein